MFRKTLNVCLLSTALLMTTTVSAANAASPSEIKTQAYNYIGTPYATGGTTSKGFDCSGFIQQVFQDQDIDLPRTTSQQYQQGTTVSKSDLETGDLVFFNTSGNGVSHVGIYIGSNQFIHSSTSNGVSVSSINDPYYWGDKYIGAKRVLEQSNAVEKAEVKSASIDMTIFASRAEVAQSIASELKLPITDLKTDYLDVKTTSEYYDAINSVTAVGIFSGNEQGKFNPSKPITRAHVAKVLVEAFNLQPGTGTYNFTDVNDSHWANEYVEILAQNGITIGKPDKSFGINDHVTFTQMDTFMDRLK